ncbi:hypothetical protein MPER_11308, partial [Moniliophthora perniciosa FA553]
RADLSRINFPEFTYLLLEMSSKTNIPHTAHSAVKETRSQAKSPVTSSRSAKDGEEVLEDSSDEDYDYGCGEFAVEPAAGSSGSSGTVYVSNIRGDDRPLYRVEPLVPGQSPQVLIQRERELELKHPEIIQERERLKQLESRITKTEQPRRPGIASNVLLETDKDLLRLGFADTPAEARQTAREWGLIVLSERRNNDSGSFSRDV